MRKSPLRPGAPRPAIDADEILKSEEEVSLDLPGGGEQELDDWDEPDSRFASLDECELELDEEPEPDAHDFWLDGDNEEPL